MQNNTHNETIKYKIAFLGMTGTGKTCIINRLVNNSFTEVYNTNLMKTNYIYEYKYSCKLPSDGFINPIDATFILEDLYGLNNTLLQTSEKSLSSSQLIEIRKSMLKEIQTILHTNLYNEAYDLKFKSSKNNNGSKDQERINFVKRIGFVFVIDCNNNGINETVAILEKILNIEKSLSYRKTEKLVVFNKSDLCYQREEIEFIQSKLKAQFGIDSYIISAKTSENFREVFERFFNKLLSRESFQLFNEDIKNEDFEIEDVKNENCDNGKCVRTSFTCGRNVEIRLRRYDTSNIISFY